MSLRRGLAAFALLPFVLTACGGSDSNDSGAKKNAAPAASGKSLMQLCEPGKTVEKAAFLEATKSDADKKKAFHFAGTLPPSPEGKSTLVADIDRTDSNSPKMSMRITSPKKTETHIILIGKDTYIMSPESNKKYQKSTAQDTDLMAFAKMSFANGEIDESTESITCVGQEDLDGKKTSRFSMKMPGQPARGGNAAGSPGGATDKFDFWFDEKGFRVKGSMPSGEFTFSKWGEKPAITEPPANQVTQAPAAKP
ncbi:hypothetical protein SAMN05421595_1712 [Austwickia chelonae]|uniref:Lipoprotein n=1 Tax=Austwickia chelonae NBRC 105200 TaxID=1184607 RepID=K6W456_9MICO|nr:hypothetical protein [Austwickia chelonae]GAB76582.1 hypothetical protein AUCHE_01_01440 [Austwickia chelonae NBRC 105200]SEW27328.1 hypothetical protein SAMN05421595_1712 [Austwickia chelonae]